MQLRTGGIHIRINRQKLEKKQLKPVFFNKILLGLLGNELEMTQVNFKVTMLNCIRKRKSSINNKNPGCLEVLHA